MIGVQGAGSAARSALAGAQCWAIAGLVVASGFVGLDRRLFLLPAGALAFALPGALALLGLFAHAPWSDAAFVFGGAAITLLGGSALAVAAVLLDRGSRRAQQ
jgi:hypothetical protein